MDDSEMPDRLRAPFAARRLARIAGTLACVLFATIGESPAQTPAATSDRELVVGLKEAPPFVMKGPAGAWQGISVDLWHKIAQDAGYKYRLVEEPTIQDLLSKAKNGSVDVAVAAITVTADRERVVDFTQSYYVSGLGIAVSTAGAFTWQPIVRTIGSFGFLQAVLALICLSLMTGLLVWLFERKNNGSFSGVKAGLTSSVWWSTLAMTQRSPAEASPQTIGGRAVAVIWMVTSIIALAVFTASVTSALTTRQLQGAVNGIGDLSSVRVGAVAGTATTETLTRLSVEHHGFDSLKHGLDALKRGEIDAMVHDRPLLAWAIRESHPYAIRLLDVSFDQQNYAFALPVGSTLRKPLSAAMLEALRASWWSKVHIQYLGRSSAH